MTSKNYTCRLYFTVTVNIAVKKPAQEHLALCVDHSRLITAQQMSAKLLDGEKRIDEFRLKRDDGTNSFEESMLGVILPLTYKQHR